MDGSWSVVSCAWEGGGVFLVLELCRIHISQPSESPLSGQQCRDKTEMCGARTRVSTR
jgi:hypothetical protein